MTVRLEGVTVSYGDRVAVRDVSVEFPAGAVGLLGRNGAGKSSILKALLGLVRPAAGRMRILDLPEDAAPDVIRARIGYMPERDSHLPGMNGFEMVTMLGRLSGLSTRDAWRRAHEVLYLVGLEEQRYRPVSGYSTGMRQKAKLAAALVHDPAVLFLDEPTNGLDPGGRDEMLGIVRQLATEQHKSVVFSTHILPDVEQVCSAVVVLDQGQVVATGELAELTTAKERMFVFEVEPVDLRLPASAGGLRVLDDGGGRWRAFAAAGSSGREVFQLVRGAGGTIRQLRLHRRSLEEVFLGAIGRAEASR